MLCGADVSKSKPPDIKIFPKERLKKPAGVMLVSARLEGKRGVIAGRKEDKQLIYTDPKRIIARIRLYGQNFEVICPVF